MPWRCCSTGSLYWKRGWLSKLPSNSYIPKNKIVIKILDFFKKPVFCVHTVPATSVSIWTSLLASASFLVHLTFFFKYSYFKNRELTFSKGIDIWGDRKHPEEIDLDNMLVHLSFVKSLCSLGLLFCIWESNQLSFCKVTHYCVCSPDYKL